jgi:hypothetical protein
MRANSWLNRKRRQAPFVRRTLRAVPAKGACPLFRLALALFVTRVGANNDQPALPPNDLAVFTDAFDTGANFHGTPVRPSLQAQNEAKHYCNNAARVDKGKAPFSAAGGSENAKCPLQY